VQQEEVIVSTVFTSSKRVTDLDGSVNGFGSVKNIATGKAQEMVSRLKEEVQVLQEEIIRTRYALNQRDALLRDGAPQEIELRNQFDSDEWCR
jgi:hypothetical protein